MMKRIALALAVVLVGAAVAGAAGRPATDERWVVVRRVVDGDTVLLTTRERVRYIGINTPEMHRPERPVEPFAREAKQFNRKLVEGKRVRLEFDVERKDQYDRLLAYVYLEDGTFVNAELIKQGYARTMTFPLNVKYTKQFRALQREAREYRRGLWGKQ